jgi:hypothetical protein
MRGNAWCKTTARLISQFFAQMGHAPQRMKTVLLSLCSITPLLSRWHPFTHSLASRAHAMSSAQMAAAETARRAARLSRDVLELIDALMVHAPCSAQKFLSVKNLRQDAKMESVGLSVWSTMDVHYPCLLNARMENVQWVKRSAIDNAKQLCALILSASTQ